MKFIDAIGLTFAYTQRDETKEKFFNSLGHGVKKENYPEEKFAKFSSGTKHDHFYQQKSSEKFSSFTFINHL